MVSLVGNRERGGTVYAPALGAGGGNPLEVQILSLAQVLVERLSQWATGSVAGKPQTDEVMVTPRRARARNFYRGSRRGGIRGHHKGCWKERAPNSPHKRFILGSLPRAATLMVHIVGLSHRQLSLNPVPVLSGS